MGRLSDDAVPYVAGAGIWYGLKFVIGVYPALVFTLCIVGIFFDQGLYGPDYPGMGLGYDGAASFWGIIICLAYMLIIGILATNIRQTWGILVFLYIVTLFPFLCWAGWMFNSDPDLLFYGVNWVPWL